MRDELFGDVVTEERRAELIERCYQNAVSLDARDAASYVLFPRLRVPRPVTRAETTNRLQLTLFVYPSPDDESF